MPDESDRLRTYCDLSSRLAQYDDRQLLALLDSRRVDGGRSREGNRVLRLGRTKTFVKRVGVTALERDNPYSTRNLYRLPTYYNYGIGSAGLGVYREIATHVRTTNWVLDGSMPHFPLMYHHRVVPRPASAVERELPDWFAENIRHWNGSKRVEAYLRQRLQAPYEVLIFLEYVPHALHGWLPRNLGRTADVVEQAGRVLAFTRKRGLLHFDCHFNNLLTDGRRVYLADFGLALDRAFDLTERERAFHRQHLDFDCGQFLNGIGYYFMDRFLKLPESRKKRLCRLLGVARDSGNGALFTALLNDFETAHRDGALKLPDAYAEAVARYRPVIALMHRFFDDLRSNRRKNTPLPNTELRSRLKAADFPAC